MVFGHKVGLDQHGPEGIGKNLEEHEYGLVQATGHRGKQKHHIRHDQEIKRLPFLIIVGGQSAQASTHSIRTECRDFKVKLSNICKDKSLATLNCRGQVDKQIRRQSSNYNCN